MLDCVVHHTPSQISKNKILMIGYDKTKHNGYNHNTRDGNSVHRLHGLSLMNLNETDVLEEAIKYSAEHQDIVGFTYNKDYHRKATDEQDSKKLFIFFHREIKEERVNSNVNNCILYVKHS